MATTIDERVVSMQFDNRQFESNVKTSMSTIEKLKQSLNFNGVSKGLKDLEHTSKRYNCFTPLADGIDAVKVKFTATQVFIASALHDLYNTAKRLIKSLSVDQITSGWSKYTQKTSSVQTIMNATGKSIDEVNAYLDKLMWYSDETSYGFADMTQSLGQLTSAGGKIENLIPMIEGIANATAFAGKGASEFSRAIYNLNQSYSAGYLQSMDWKSLDLAGVSSKQLKQVFIDTAIALGKLDKNGKTAKGTLVDIGSFGQTLNEKWADTEVMEAAFGKFAELTEAAYAAVQAGEYDTAAEAIEALAGKYDEVAVKAFQSAQEAKTFTEAIEATKDAVSSGWMKTFELIFGNYEESKKLWTNLANTLWEIFASGGESRNDFLSKVLRKSTWDDIVKGVNDAGVETKDFENILDKTLSENGINVDALVDKYGSLGEAFKKNAVSSKYLRQALKELNIASKESMDLSLLKSGMDVGKTGDDVKQLEKALISLGYTLTGKDGTNYGEDGFYGTLTRDAVKAFQKDRGLKVTGIVDEETINELKKATARTTELGEAIYDLVDGVTLLGGREVLIEGLKNAFNGLLTFMRPIKNAFNEVFKVTPEQVFNVIQKFTDFTKVFKLNEDQIKKLQTAFEGFFSVIGIGLDFAKELGSGLWELAKTIVPGAADGILTFAGNIGTWCKNLRVSIKDGKIFSTVVKGLTGLLLNTKETLKDWYEQVKKFFKQPEVQNWIKEFKMDFGEAFSNIGEKLKALGGRFLEFFNKLRSGDFKSISEALKNFKETIIDFLFTSEDGNIFERIGKKLKGFWNALGEYLQGVSDGFYNVWRTVSNFVQKIKDTLSGNVGNIAAIGFLASFGLLTIKIYKTIKNVVGPLFDLIGGMAKSARKFIEGLSGIVDAVKNGVNELVKAKKFETRAKGFKTLAESLIILAGAIAIIALLPQENLWNAVIVLSCVNVILITLAASMALINKYIGGTGEMAKFSGTILALSTSMTIFALAARMIGGLDVSTLIKSGAVIAGMLLALLSLSAIAKKFGGTKAAGFGATMMALTGSLMMFATAAAMIGMLSTTTLIKAGSVVLGLITTILALASVSSKVGTTKWAGFGATVLALAFSLQAFAAAAYMISGLSPNALTKTAGAIAILVGAIAGLALVANNIGGTKFAGFGATMLALSSTLLIIATSIFVFGHMSDDTLKRGLLSMTLCIGVIVAAMAALSGITKSQVGGAKIASTMFGFSVAILSLAGAITLLSLIKPADLAKAVVAIGALVGMVTALVWATKFLQEGKFSTTIFALCGAIGVLAISLAALSFIEPTKLLAASGALSAVMGMLSLLVAMTKFLPQKAIGSLIVITTMVALVGGIVYLLSTMPIENTIGSAGALSAVIVALSVACKLLSAIPIVGALKGIAALAIISAGLAAIVIGYVKMAKWLSGDFPEIGTNLSNFMKNLEPFIDGAKNIDSSAINSVSKIADMISTLISANLKDKVSKWLFGGDSALKTLGDQLKPFGEALAEFSKPLEGIKVDTDTVNTLVDGVAKLAEAANKVPKAIGIGLGIGGFVSVPMLNEFRNWIVQVLPVMKDFAIDVHNAKLNEADFDNVTVLCDSINVLAEAASKAPSVKAGGGFAKVAGVIAAGGYISWPLLDSFTNWITSVAPIMENFASNLHLNKISATDCNNVSSLCTAVSTLAEAASKGPSIKGGVGVAKFAGGVAGFVGISVPLLREFTNWITSIIDPMSNFANAMKGDKAAGIASITTNDCEHVAKLCEAVKILSEAADKASGIEVGGGLAKFAGGLGGGGYVTIPMLDSFNEWISGVTIAMCDIATTVRTYGFEDSDLEQVKSICDDVKLLGEAAGSAPTLDVAGGLYAGTFGFAIAGAVSIPQLNEFKEWIAEILPVMEEFAQTVEGHNLDPTVYGNVKTICESVLTLGNAVSNVPGFDIQAAGGAIGPLIAGYVSIGIPDYTGFGEWIQSTASAMGTLVGDIANASAVGEIDYDGISKICTAISTLCTTVFGSDSNAPGSTTTIAGAKLGPILLGYMEIKTDNLSEFGNWVNKAASAVTTLAGIKLPGEGETGIDYEGVTTLCEGVATLASAAEHAPTKEQCEAFGYERVQESQITEFAGWFTTILPALETFATDISKAKIDTNAVTAVANAGKLLGEMADALPEDEQTTVLWGLWSSSTTTEWGTFADNIEGFGEAMAKFSKTITGDNAINPEAITAAATAGKILAEMSLVATNLSALAVAVTQFKTFDELVGLFAQTIVGFSTKVSGNVDNASITAASQAGYTVAQTLVTLSTSGWEDADIETFESKLNDLAIAIISFSSKLSDIDPSSAISKVRSVVTMLKTMPTSFDGPDSLKEALKTLSASGIDDFVSDFENAEYDVSSAVSTFIGYFVSGIADNTPSATGAIEGMVGDCTNASGDKYQDFYDAGGYLVEGFAAGIYGSTFKATIAAMAMAQAALNAAKAILKINSPSKVFMMVGQSVPEGFAMGIDQLGGLVNNSVNTMADDALSGTKSAISRLSDIVDEGIDTNPTIRPVLDLTDIESGANSISGMFSMKPSVGVMANVGAISSMMNNNQNGSNSDVIAAIENLGRKIGNTSGNTYNVNGITYDDGSNVSDAVKTLVRAARVERRR